MNGEMAEGPMADGRAIRYFDENAKLWADRYSDPGSSGALWERHRSILGLIDEWNSSASFSFLDVGCGAGLLTVDLARRGLRGVGIDGAASMIASCQEEARRLGISEQWQYLQADVERIPFPDGSFDVAICCGVIEYLRSDDDLLREVRRVLRPGGRFILCVTNKYGYSVSLYPLFQAMKRIPGVIRIATAIRQLCTGRRVEMMNLPCKVRRHSPALIRQILVANGFRIEKDRFSGFTLLPGPFHLLFSRLERSIAANVSKMNRTRLRRFGSFYMTSSRLE
jgi:ubiquinone/menaquinone biosynthesis C-methylase UbiE